MNENNLSNNSNIDELLVLEMSSAKLTPTKSEGDNKYILEGVFTEIGIKNNNNRIYTESQVLPQIEKLQILCEQGKLLGELDHPKSFEISLSNCSHKIESLKYDKDKQQVIGRIKLLNTTAGKNAQAMVDAGVPLHISSRSAGTVKSNGEVQIRETYTYDLVHTPGFANAQLNCVNESYGFSNNSNILLFRVHNDNILEENKSNEKIYNNQMEKYVTIEDFNDYTKIIKNEINELKGTINENKKTTDSAELAKIIEYTETIAKTVNDMQDVILEGKDNINYLIKHNDYIVENLENIKNYSEYVGKTSNDGINYTEKLAESLDYSIEYVKMLSEKLDQNISYSNYITENMTNRDTYQSYVNEHVDNLISHNDYIVEGSDSIIKYSEYLKGEVENITKYLDYMANTHNEKVSPTTNVNENASSTYMNNINSKIEQLLTEASSKVNPVFNNELRFLNFLTESKREEFFNLNDNTKAKIVSKFENSKYYGTKDIEKIWESCFVNESANKLNWLANMPSKYIASWNMLNESQKNAVKAQASVKLLETQNQIDEFWHTRDLRAIKVNDEVLNTKMVNENSNYETNDAYMEAVINGFRKYNNRF